MSRWLGYLALSLLLLASAGLSGIFYLQQLLDRQNITLTWQDTSFFWNGIQFDGLYLSVPDRNLTLTAERARLEWSYRVILHNALLDWQRAADADGYHSGADSDLRAMLESFRSLSFWLPRHLELHASTLLLPCAQKRCSLPIQSTVSNRRSIWSLRLETTRQSHSANLQAQIYLSPESDLTTEGVLFLDHQQALTFSSRWQFVPRQLLSQGRLQLSLSPETRWLSDWLQEWQTPDQRTPASPEQSNLQADWQLALPADELRWQRLTGQLHMAVQLDSPWPVPGIGILQGQMAISLGNDMQSGWLFQRLQADLSLQPSAQLWPDELPDTFRPDHLHLQITPQPSPTTADLPVNIRLQALGSLSAQAQADAVLNPSRPWHAQIRRLDVSARMDTLKESAWQAVEPSFSLQASGSIDTQQARLSIEQARFSALRLQLPEQLTLQQVVIDLQAAQADWSFQSADASGYRLAGRVALQTQRLTHPQLHPQAWQYQGRLQATAQQLDLRGQLNTTHGLNADLNLQQNNGSALKLNARLQEIFFRSGNPLAQTFKDWPELLSFDNGRLQADTRLSFGGDRPLQMTAELSAQGLNGIYDRSAISGLDARLQARIEGDDLAIDLAELQIATVDPGIPLAPVSLSGTYRARLDRMDTGSVTLEQARAGLLGGSLELSDTRWSLSETSPVLPVQIQRLDLAELFRIYPATGLQGNGLIDGQLPLQLNPQGVTISAGEIQAQSPGGFLQFHSPRIQAMAQSNPAMQLVADALKDFHYILLDGKVDYDLQGKLLLNMRLHGQSPVIEQERPIHFSITLEEDIPKLLASLQLTDKVSDIIKQRVQKRMLQRQSIDPIILKE